MAREPAILAYATPRQNEAADIFARIVAEQLGVDPRTDLRSRLVVQAAFAGVEAAWTVWINGDDSADLHALVNQAFDVLDTGLARV
jgi:hypothetical protein